MSIAEDYLQFQQELIATFLAEAFEPLEGIEEQLGVWKNTQSQDSIDDIEHLVLALKELCARRRLVPTYWNAVI